MKTGKLNRFLPNKDLSYDGWDKVFDTDDISQLDKLKIGDSIIGNFSARFEGAESVNVADSADWDIFGNLNNIYTISFFAKTNNLDSLEQFISQEPDTGNYWSVFNNGNAGNGIAFQFATSSTNRININEGSNIPDNKWHHYTVVIIGNGSNFTVGLYRDENQVGYATTSTTGTFAQDVILGKRSNNTRFYNGNMSNVVIYSGNLFSANPDVGLTDTIEVPNSFHVSDANTKLLLTFDNTFEDTGNTGHTVTNNGAIIAGSPIGNGYCEFNSAESDYLSTPDSADWDAFDDVTDNFTIDFYARISHSGTECFVAQYQDGSNSWIFRHTNGVGLQFLAISGGSVVINTGGAGEITDNLWHHIALVKIGTGSTNQYGIYVDGVQVDYLEDNSTVSLSSVLRIGSLDGTQQFVNGALSNGFRMQASNIFGASPDVGLTDTIEVPTSLPETDANTKLLLTFDSNINDEIEHVITNNGATPVNDIFPTTELNIYDLDGDTDEIYMIDALFISDSSGVISFRINSDSGSNYGQQHVRAQNTTVAANRETANTSSTAAVFGGADYLSAFKSIIYAKSGNVRVFNSTVMRSITGETIDQIRKKGEAWNNTVDNLTSFSFIHSAGNMISGSRIVIYKRVTS